MCTLMNGEVVKRIVRCDLHEERAHVRCQGVHPSSVAKELHGTLDKFYSVSPCLIFLIGTVRTWGPRFGDVILN